MTPNQAKREAKQILLDGRAFGLSGQTIAKALLFWAKKHGFTLPVDVFGWLGKDDPRFRIKRTVH